MPELFKGEFSRRQILTTAGLGAISAAAIGSMGEEVAAQQPTVQATPRGGELPPQIQFPPISEKTEVDTGGLPTALPPERRLGFAIVGLGRLALEIDHIADCVIQNKQPHTPGEEGLQDQKLIALIYEAAQTGKTIALPRVSGLDTTRGPAPRMLK
ncbi:MAG: Gfo/Idh/MocA family oxidoreductase [Nostoc sp.]|uniref:Gfo/Idh/MocA family oxidoreductase n=1 Tax=Nostoc sp. TaxID=1180 RepID=UPI002FF9342A